VVQPGGWAHIDKLGGDAVCPARWMSWYRQAGWSILVDELIDKLGGPAWWMTWYRQAGWWCCLSSPLDELIDKLGGPEHVAEMTGRRWRVVRQSSSDLATLQLRDSSLEALGSSSNSSNLDSLNVREVVHLCIEISSLSDSFYIVPLLPTFWKQFEASRIYFHALHSFKRGT